MRLLLLFLIFSPPGHAAKKSTHKYYTTISLPRMSWRFVSDTDVETPYRHEIVTSGGKIVPVRPGSNYSVHPTGACHEQRIAFIVQLSPKRMAWTDSAERQDLTCTISITLDDGHVEVWYGLCRGPKPTHLRKFDFPLNQMYSLYFSFDGFTMRMYRRDGDDGQDFEMGKIEHVPPNRGDKDKDKYTAFDQFTAFLYYDSCPSVTLKTVYHVDDWRHTKKKVEGKRSSNTALLVTMVAIFSFIMSGAALILSTMYIWSKGEPFFSNRIYDAVFARFSKDSPVNHQEQAEANSCKTAEDCSVDETKGEKENIFGDKGRPGRLPPGHTAADWDAPLVEDEEDCGLKTAIDAQEQNANDVQVVPDSQSNAQQPGGEPAKATPQTPPPPAKPDQADKKAAAPDAKPAGGITV